MSKIYLITETSTKSGIDTWNNNFMRLVEGKIECEAFNIRDYKKDGEEPTELIEKMRLVNNSIIVLNNVTDRSFIDKDMLIHINENSNRLYYVFHGDICPVNKTFVSMNKLFHGAISISLKVKAILQKHYPKRHIVYLPNSISTREIKRESKRRLSEEVQFGFLGRISAEKNVPLLLNALSRYINRGTKRCYLHIFGDVESDDYMEHIEKIAHRLGIIDSVIFHGWVDDIDSIYDKIDILLLPSVSEGVSYSAIEASHYGVPVISSDVGCMSEIIVDGHNGLLFNLDGYPKVKSLHVKDYDCILSRLGYVKCVQTSNGKDVTDNNIHTCGGRIFSDESTKFMIPGEDCSINSSKCNPCMELLDKRLTFSMNTNRLVDKMMYAVENYEHLVDNLVPIYSDEDTLKKIDIAIEELIDDKVIDRTDISSYYPFDRDDYDGLVIKTRYRYGVYYHQMLRPLPYTLSIEYSLVGQCYLFVCEGDETVPFAEYDLSPESRRDTFSFKVDGPGHYKIGIRFRDSCIKGEIDVRSISLRMADVKIPLRDMVGISRYDIKLLDSRRYNPNQNIDKVLFMFITCDREEYKEQNRKLMEYVETFRYRYIIVKAGAKRTTYDEDNRILTVNCKEVYENLPKKIIKALSWIDNNMDGYSHVYKVDDDFVDRVLDFIPVDYKEYDYYGNFVVGELIDTWHQGKCSSNLLNGMRYEREFIGRYAGGGYGYMLSENAINILLDNYSKIEDDLYEDKIVGDILYQNGIMLNVPRPSNEIQVCCWQALNVRLDNGVNLSVYSSNTESLICIVDDGSLKHQKMIDTIPTLVVSPTGLLSNRDNKVVQLLSYDFGAITEVNRVDMEIDRLRISDKSDDIEIDGHLIKKSSDSKVILDSRVHFNVLYLLKWIDMGISIDTNNIIESDMYKTAALHEISYDDIDNYDVVVF